MATSIDSTDSAESPSPGNGRPSISTTPLFAALGATDLAVQQVRAAAAGAAALQQKFASDVEARLAGVEKRVTSIDPKVLREQAEQAPTRAVARALEVAVRAEAVYSELARRGKDLVERVSTQSDTQTFRAQAGSTLDRGRAAVTVARRAADDTATALRGTLRTGRPGAAEPTEVTEPTTKLNEEAVLRAVAVGDGGDKAVTRPRTPAKKTSTTRKSAAVTGATKTTTARKSAGTGPRATKSPVPKPGE
ncbi:hypothetical protein [Kineosporia sp. NBRC 101731]|uniref:hypothetical protein n=1 Tax=Kineosporia sp. NBRC 101731 TaxID=3032199 RepID=UPI0024A1E3B3|nr:hypothetical protein [Kineosporia sp. NBRC 101731]GLY27498.1 hypothetical protein Kisp02_08630 [Kineosporia sp. NBRC 101731]